MSGVVGTIAELLAFWARRARERKDLAKLDERLLADIGISPADARHEVRKLPWQD